jgi:hypothetical protein
VGDLLKNCTIIAPLEEVGIDANGKLSSRSPVRANRSGLLQVFEFDEEQPRGTADTPHGRCAWLRIFGRLGCDSHFR